MIKRIGRIALITAVVLILITTTTKAATLTGNVSFIVNNANGTNLNYNIYNLKSSSGTVTLELERLATLDNKGGGAWKRVDVFKLTTATTETAQYCIQINGNWINVTNSTGYLKASLYDDEFWTYVNSTGADIRICNQSSQLYFWIEKWDYTNQTAIIWVNLTAGSTELNIFYGNPNATESAYENSTQVFELYEDFEDSSFTDKFTQYGTASGSLTFTTDEGSIWLRFYPNAANTWIGILSKKVFKAGNYVMFIYYNNVAGSTGERLELQKHTENTVIVIQQGVYGSDAATGTYKVKKVVTFNLSVDEQIGIIVTRGGWDADYRVDYIIVAKSTDPANFGTPSAKNIYIINATASINGISFVAQVLNSTVPSQTFTLPELAASNWFNFSAERGQFSAYVTFSFTSSFTQEVTANFTELIVNTSVYVPANCTSNKLTISFNTSTVPTGVVIHSYNISVLVDGSEVNFTKTATENLNVWYITVSTSGLSEGWHNIKVLLVYQPAYINLTVYNANNVTLLLNKTLNVTIYDTNFNVLASATVNKTANISIVYAGKVFVKISNALGIARQLETVLSPGNTTNLTFYFPTQNVVLATIQLVDYTNSFSNATVMIKRYITRNNIAVVDAQKVSANLQTSHYLIANVPYEVFITNGIDTRDLGYISVAYSQTITLYIGSILNINSYPYVGVEFQINRTNNSIIVTYKTEHGTTSEVNVVITNSTGYEVFNTTLTTQEGKVVYLINNTNETYYVSFHAENTFSPVTYRTIVSSAYTFSPVLPVLAGGDTLSVSLTSLPSWMRSLFFGGLVIFTALLFRRQFVPIGLTVSLAVLALFVLTNILKLSTNLLYVLATIVMIAWFAWWRRRG